jgi:hypothetical protein
MMLRARDIAVKEKRHMMRLKKQDVLSRELAEVTYGENDIRSAVGNRVRILHLSVKPLLQ